MEILKIEDLSFKYSSSENETLKNISLSIDEGEFTLICGETGSGKSTLLRLLKKEISPLGEKTGRIFYKNTPFEDIDGRIAARTIGYVGQSPEHQIVTDKVWHEIAFGLEEMGLPQSVMAAKVAEMASYFGIEEWFDKKVSELSGGQKQLLCLASVMVMDPDILILDEPSAQLDPIAASDFFSTVRKLNEDFSLTVIIAEHRLEELFPICDRLVVLEGGRIAAMGEARSVVSSLCKSKWFFRAMPAAARLYHMLGKTGEFPLTITEGRRFISENLPLSVRLGEHTEYKHSPAVALEYKKVYFRYGKDEEDVLNDISFKVYENEIFCILGGNGSGKTTALGAAAGILNPYSGYIKVFGKKLKEYKNQSLYKNCLAMLPQDVQTVFLRNTVREELIDAGADMGALAFDISHLYDKHPYDLSGGEQQILALLKVLAQEPKLILMDEPTKGLDAGRRLEFIELLKKLKSMGLTAVIVTHDVEFAALCADRCALFFRGSVATEATPADFFSKNRFYTTAARRLTKGFFDGAVTLESVAELFESRI